ncbi:MAG TPA: MFS transporter, partial [Bradyrhizobium sp.]|nr:MFS transporter [Bradyrhizobium sp.]
FQRSALAMLVRSRQMIDRKAVASLSIAHLINDWYMNYIQVLLPFLVASGLGLSAGAFLISAFTITSSISQPVFGYLVDRRNQHWFVYVGTFWMALLICLVGVVKNYPLMFCIAALSGLGTAAFHPQASSMVSAASGDSKGFYQSCFMAAGNLGWALTPITVAPFTNAYGLEWTPVFVLPGLLVAILVRFVVRDVAPQSKGRSEPILPVLRENGAELGKVALVVALRSLTYFSLIAFLPLYLQAENVPLMTGSRLLFIMLFAGAVGGIAGGYLSDRIGRKQVVVGSLVLASPFFYLFLGASGAWSYILLALAGASLLASFSVTVVVAQEIASRHAAMASGLMLGFAVGVGGLGVGIAGALAEAIGLAPVVHVLIWLPAAAGLLWLVVGVRTASDAQASPA